MGLLQTWLVKCNPGVVVVLVVVWASSLMTYTGYISCQLASCCVRLWLVLIASAPIVVGAMGLLQTWLVQCRICGFDRVVTHYHKTTDQSMCEIRRLEACRPHISFLPFCTGCSRTAYDVTLSFAIPHSPEDEVILPIKEEWFCERSWGEKEMLCAWGGVTAVETIAN